MVLLKINAFSWPFRWRVWAAILAPAWCAGPVRPAPAPALEELQIKAAALSSIITFTEWPATAFASPESPLVVGVLGHDPTAALLTDFVANEIWQGRGVVLRTLASPSEAKTCHAVYIAHSENGRWRTLSAQFAGKPILTISDGENFARQGGIIQLAVERNKLRLIVNLGVARAAGLAISSKVLRLAEIIDETRS